jgi:hypothetical protein
MDDNMNLKSKTIYQYLALFGVLCVIMFFLHCIIGSSIYNVNRGYNGITQYISELTADNAPSRVVGKVFLTLFSIFQLIFSIVLLMIFNKKSNKFFYYGLIAYVIVGFLSFFIYLFFPLTSVVTALNTRNILHNVFNTLSLISYSISLLLIGIGLMKNEKYKWLSYTAFILLAISFIAGILTATVMSMKGLFERINFYSLLIFSAILSLWVFSLSNDDLRLDNKQTVKIS